MATLSIRNLPDDVHARLRVAQPADLQRLVDALYQGRKPKSVVDAFLAERRAEAGAIA